MDFIFKKKKKTVRNLFVIYSNHWSDVASAAKLMADGGTTSWVNSKSFNVILSPHLIRVSKEFSAPRHQWLSIKPAEPFAAFSDHRRTSAQLTGSRGGQPPSAYRNLLGKWAALQKTFSPLQLLRHAEEPTGCG